MSINYEDKQFLKSISKREIAESQKLIDKSDIEKRQVPLKVFKRNGRDDYSFKKQLNKIYDFGLEGHKVKELIERIDENNNANGFDVARHY